TFSIQSGPGSFVGGVNTCTTIGATGDCTVQITSSTAGPTPAPAGNDVTLARVALHRETGDANVRELSDANKVWQQPDANIQITPANATNPVNTNHTLTCHVNVSHHSATLFPYTTLFRSTFSIQSGPGSFVGGVNTCTTIG